PQRMGLGVLARDPSHRAAQRQAPLWPVVQLSAEGVRPRADRLPRPLPDPAGRWTGPRPAAGVRLGAGPRHPSPPYRGADTAATLNASLASCRAFYYCVLGA